MIKNKNVEAMLKNQAVGLMIQQLGPAANTDFGMNLQSFVVESMVPTERATKQSEIFEKSMVKTRAMSKEFRKNTRAKAFPTYDAVSKANPEMRKAVLDVGSITNFAQINGGQSLGYVSLDTELARGTVRPKSFTLYQALDKTAAFQVVDYWAYTSSTGGPAPGGAFNYTGNVATGTLPTSAGQYELNYITLKLALNGRAITIALAAQNSFVDIVGQENTNAALSVMESINWANYWGNPTLYSYQFEGIYQTVLANAPNNIFDFQEFYNGDGSANGWSYEQTLFNMIYDAAAQVTAYRQYGQITHAFMTPNTAAGLQSLVTTLLNNVVNNLTPNQIRADGIVINGDLQGMKTRFGDIQFPVDLFISVRDIPVQAIDLAYNATDPNAINLASMYPASVSAVASTVAAAGSDWTAKYAPSGNSYMYAAAGCDSSMNESTLVYSASVTGVIAGGDVTVTITPSSSNAAVAFRVFRSGLGYTAGTPAPAQFRYIGDVAANGTSAVTFVDLNTHIPGSETVFLLDMDEQDNAIDYRFLLPLSRIELFAQNLYMPWAVATIGAIRVRIPKFHSIIKNITLTSLGFNPLSSNNPNV